MGGEEGNFTLQWVAAALRLPLGLRGADQDVADVELAVRIAAQLSYSLFTFRPADGLPEGKDVGRAVLLPVPPVERTHLVVIDERNRDSRIRGERVPLHRGAHGTPDRGEIARRGAADRESQRPEASGGGVAAGGRRAMRSSGYGMRS